MSKPCLNRWASLLVAVVYLAACGGDDPLGSGGNGNGSGNGSGNGGATLSVAVQDNRFTPSSLTIPQDSTVTWTWGGSSDHNVTFNDGSAISDVQSTGTFSWTFGQTGAFAYFCSVHGAAIMSGVITVE